MSPALALGWYIWTRHRRGLSLLGVYWLATMIFGLFMPPGVFESAPDGSGPPLLWMFLVFLSCSSVPVAYILLIFSFSWQVRLEARESSFPPGLWHLPLPTRALVGWPMLEGSVALVFLWATLAWAARRLCDCDVPLLWPGLLLATILAWLQAIVWMPFPLPWVRAFLLLPLGSLLVYPPVAILALGVPLIAVSGLFVVLLAAAYWTAVRGAARARRGEHVHWGWPAWLRWQRTATARPPFASAERAQLWFEWRRNGLALPIMIVFCCLTGLPMFSLYARVVADRCRKENALLLPALLHELGSLWLTMAIFLLFVPLMLAPGCGWELGKLPGRQRTRVLSSFMATRPLTTAALVLAKWRTAARITLTSWGLLALGLFLWLAFGGRAAEMAEQFESMRQRHAPALFWGWLILFPVAALVLTWLQIVQGIGIGLLKNNIGGSFAGLQYLLLFGLVFFGQWVPDYPEYGVMFRDLLPWLAGAAVVLKCLAASWSLSALHRRALIPTSVFWGALGIWLALAVGIFAALNALLPREWFSVPGVLLGIALLMPLTRLALAPLALAWKRHC